MWKVPIPARASVEEMCGLCLPRVVGLGPVAENVTLLHQWARTRNGYGAGWGTHYLISVTRSVRVFEGLGSD